MIKLKSLLKEASKETNNDYDKLNNIFDNKLGELVGWGSTSFVFDWEDDKVIKIKNTNNDKYNDWGFYETYDMGSIDYPHDVLSIDNIHLSVRNNTLWYVIMEKLEISKELYNRLDDVEFVIDRYLYDQGIDWKKPPLLWLLENNTKSNLIRLAQTARNDVFDSNKVYNDFLETLSELSVTMSKVKERGVEHWKDVHKGNFGYNSDGDIVPFDTEF